MNKARVHQPTKSFEEHVAHRTGNLRDLEDKQKRQQQIEIEHRKLDENWNVPIGVKRTEEQPPTRFSVTPKQKPQDFLLGSEGTSFHETDKVRDIFYNTSLIRLSQRRYITTKTALDSFSVNPHAQEREVQRQKEEAKLERIRSNQKRAEGVVAQEDTIKNNSREQTIKSKGDQLKSYMDVSHSFQSNVYSLVSNRSANRFHARNHIIHVFLQLLEMQTYYYGVDFIRRSNTERIEEEGFKCT